MMRKKMKAATDYLKDNRGYWKLKEEVLDHTVWRTHFGRGCVLIIRQTIECMNKLMNNRQDFFTI